MNAVIIRTKDKIKDKGGTSLTYEDIPFFVLVEKYKNFSLDDIYPIKEGPIACIMNAPEGHNTKIPILLATNR